MKNLIQGALRQLDVIPAGATVVPICYSLGGVFMELVAERRPDLFTHPIGIGTNGVGAPLRTIFRTIKSVWKRFLVGLLTGQLVLDRAAANSLFWYGRETPGNLDELLRHAHPQPMRGILGLARTMIWEAVKNIFRREKRLPWSTFASATVLVPERCAISTGTRFAPGVTVITCPGGHAVIFSYREIRQLMETAVAWIDF
ncbi:hypothetical protein HY734_00865 [Candidatus Uhrbacteria bacterium]|nr:hypothetical protein [Candidatus Uhrbacteria bacterium]